MEIAQKLIEEKGTEDEIINPIDARFRSLDLESIQPISPASKEFSALATYARDTHGTTHSYYKVSIQTAFRIKRLDSTLEEAECISLTFNLRKFEDENWSKAGFDKMEGHRMLLWHGSRSTNFAGILLEFPFFLSQISYMGLAF